MTKYRAWMYDHDVVPTESLITPATLKLLFVLAGMVFKDKEGKRLKKLEFTQRLRDACSVILECKVQHISKLAQSDASVVLAKLEPYAKASGSWKPSAAPEPQVVHPRDRFEVARKNIREAWNGEDQGGRPGTIIKQF
jgi:hypothetical protein